MMIKSNKTLLGVSVLLFAILFLVGILLSQRKPLWNDELYTQKESVERPSYAEILSGRLPEGNNFPLFYLIQKIICGVSGYRLGDQWHSEWQLSEPRGQVILRISADIFMSLSLALIFYYFAGQFSLTAGVYALLVALSSQMVWGYWAEARPYALWFFLTTVQLLLILGKNNLRALLVVNFLLALTVSFGVLQIFLISALLLLEKRCGWKKCSAIFVLPLLVFMFYFIQSPRFRFHLPADPLQQLILPNFPFEWLAITVLYFIFNKDRRYWIVLMGMLSSAAGIILLIAWMSPKHGEVAFEISSRYFIYLVPAGIIGITLFSIRWVQMFKGQPWMFANTVIVLAGLLMMRFLKTMTVW